MLNNEPMIDLAFHRMVEDSVSSWMVGNTEVNPLQFENPLLYICAAHRWRPQVRNFGCVC